MCKLCEGWMHDQLLARQVEHIETYGFTLISVTDPVSWTYSIGLRWRLDMPEVVLVGYPPHASCAVIHGVVDEVRKGSNDVRCGSVLQVGGSPVGLGRVAPDNAAGEWFTQWHGVARACGQGHRTLRALQLQPQCGADCGEPHALLDHALAHRTTPRPAPTEEAKPPRRWRAGAEPQGTVT